MGNVATIDSAKNVTEQPLVRANFDFDSKNDATHSPRKKGAKNGQIIVRKLNPNPPAEKADLAAIIAKWTQTSEEQAAIRAMWATLPKGSVLDLDSGVWQAATTEQNSTVAAGVDTRKPDPVAAGERTRYIVSLSSGVPSAVTAQRAIDRYRRENVVLVFADTTWEDTDNYRFLADLEQRWGEIIRLTDGRTPLGVADDRQIIPNQKIAPCTFELKLKLIQDYAKSLQAQGFKVVMCIGMDWKDRNKGRLAAPIKNWKQIGINVRYPLLWKGKDLDPQATVKTWGIEAPRMYQQGYKHANCGGRCVKQGKRDWRRTLENYPERFMEVENWEREKRKDPRFSEYAILRDETGGEVKAYTLEQLRLEVESRDQSQPRLWDMQDDLAGCSVECGVGDWQHESAGERTSGLVAVGYVDNDGVKVMKGVLK